MTGRAVRRSVEDQSVLDSQAVSPTAHVLEVARLFWNLKIHLEVEPSNGTASSIL